MDFEGKFKFVLDDKDLPDTAELKNEALIKEGAEVIAVQTQKRSRYWDRFPTYEPGYDQYNYNNQDSLKFTPKEDVELMGFTCFTRHGCEGETQESWTFVYKYELVVGGKTVIP